ncbi:3',5'-cyclic adenosine monophosphate phosphodiesterase CpdA [Marinibacterium anthonyi]|nr:3',5'-cyclic adenosine monophosphate phosphodiesterase CpdA [Marinibacterium anthonyi]
MIKIVVLSDLHLRGRGDPANGLDPHDRLRLGIDWLNRRHADADLCVLAGDLADVGDRDAYELLKHQVMRAKVPVEMTIGNHDDRDTFLKVFGEAYRAETGYIDKSIDIGGYRVIILDSAITGEPAGRLEPAQLHWLGLRLDEAADRPVIVIVHHHANPLMTRVDRILMQNGTAFARVLSRHKDIRQVIAGHVHYTSTAIWHGIPFTTLSGGHYSVRALLDPDEPAPHLTGPAQMAVILAGTDGTIVHFDDYINGNARIGQP